MKTQGQVSLISEILDEYRKADPQTRAKVLAMLQQQAGKPEAVKCQS